MHLDDFSNRPRYLQNGPRFSRRALRQKTCVFPTFPHAFWITVAGRGPAPAPRRAAAVGSARGQAKVLYFQWFSMVSRASNRLVRGSEAGDGPHSGRRKCCFPCFSNGLEGFWETVPGSPPGILVASLVSVVLPMIYQRFPTFPVRPREAAKKAANLKHSLV